MLRYGKPKSAVSAILAVLVVIIIVLAVIAGVAFALKPSSSTVTTTSIGTSVVTSLGTTTATSLGTTTAVSTSIGTTTATSVTTATSTLGSATISPALVSEAEAECSGPGTCLTVLTTLPAANWNQTLLPAFLAEFPWATGKVVYDSMSSAVYTTTVETDYQTHSVIADTLTGSAALMWSLIDDGAVQPYTSPIVSQMGYSSTTYGADYATTSIQPNVLVYNPTYLTQHDIPIPTSWQNLTNPVYKGLITFQNPATLSSTGGIFYYLAQQMTNSSWNTLMKGIAANNPIVTTSPVTSVDDVYEGTAAIGITIFNDYSSLLSAGTTTNSSLAIDEQGQFSTSIYTPGYVSIANGAPDPYMGELMESWLLSPPGQTAFAFIATVPLFTPIAQELNEVPSSLTLVNGFGNPALFNDTGSWSDLFNNIFSGT